MKKLIISFAFIFSMVANAANPAHSVSGVVIDKTTRNPVEYAAIVALGLSKSAVTDSLGRFTIENLVPGAYSLKVSLSGMKDAFPPEFYISTRDITLNIEMEPSVNELSTITVTASPFRREIDAPIGMRVIGIREIEKSPGANRDISKIVQSYPGVAFSPAGYRNDLIVRGGSPSENRFYLDGIEIPNINHFSTEGASGGPVGIINADFIREVKFYTGAIPSNRGNALSSVLDFRLIDGNYDNYTFKATLGASEFSLATTGHIGEKTTYIVSARQSYLQLLFKMLGLPFLPTFTDGQFKVKTKFDKNNELTILGIMGFDDMKLNTSLNDESAEYILSYLPTIKQETVTVGAAYRHYAGIHSQLFTLSHSYLNNRNIKYIANDDSSEDNLRLKIRSIENETKFRFENTTLLERWKINAGANIEYANYSGDSFIKTFNQSSLVDNTYNSTLNMIKWGIFATASYSFPGDRFTASAGLRSDGADYSSRLTNMLKHISPRLSLSYRIADNLFVNANAGVFYQLPPYTSLGYRNDDGELLNKELDYMRVSQGSVGFNWHKGNTLEFSLEGFYKGYGNIPLSITDNIPLACKGDDYGIVGNELLVSSAQGRSYGIEFLARWFIAQRLNLSSSVTVFKSEYRNDEHSNYIASAWDNRFIINITGTYDLPKNWSVGMKFKCIGGAPFTPYDVDKSSLVSAWNAKGQPYFDYSKYNTERQPAFAQLDLRIDKTFYIRKCMLGFYLDLQNITKSQFKRQDVLMSTGIIENPTAPAAQQRYKMKYIEQKSGTLLPSIGITFEY
ncbi:MAG: TonB-dependent receptor [Muribaculaceae bacterium]|nr:TonB-dependent receptor [Muribaculaceae bacterium]